MDIVLLKNKGCLASLMTKQDDMHAVASMHHKSQFEPELCQEQKPMQWHAYIYSYIGGV